jgi:hypothetical protein
VHHMQIKIPATTTDRNWRDIGAFSPVVDRFEACASLLETSNKLPEWQLVRLHRFGKNACQC